MASSQPDHITQTTQTKLPHWVNMAAKSNYQLASELGTDKFNQYQGQRVADLSPMMQKAQNYLQDSMAQAKNAYGGASSIFDKIGDFNLDPRKIQMGQLSDTNLKPYMNPYTDQVINRSMADMDQSRREALMQNSDQAVSAGAFGGSRQGITDAVTNAQSIKDQGLMASQLRSQNFMQAQQAAEQDIQGKYSSQVGNRDANMQAAMARLGAMGQDAQGQMGIAGAQQAAALQNYQQMMQSGMLKTQHSQDLINSKIQKFNEPRDYALQNLNLRLSSLGMSPYGKTENTDKTETPASSGADWMTGGLGIMSLLLSL
jgi:hypothetical protein